MVLDRDGSTVEAIVTILDGDSAPIISLSNTSVNESSGRAEVDYTLDIRSSSPIIFTWSTEDRTAVASSDYTPVTEKEETVPAKTLSGTLPVAINEDGMDEPDEEFRVAIIKDGITQRAKVTIIDTDPPPELAIADLDVDEGEGQVEVSYRLARDSGKPVSFTYSTKDGTARAGEDYNSVPTKEITIPVGVTEGTFSIPYH